MRIRRLVLKLVTDQGNHGATLDFPDGLVVLWADNSMGKSTCLKSIMWALGLEAMLTTSHTDVPLPPAMKAQLSSGTDSASVIESEVFVEIQNSRSEVVVVHRAVKSSRDIHLVTVTFGPALTTNATFRSEDFFVSRPGGATSDRGFHQFLAKFVGWSVPDVQTFEGRFCPLYLQCIFPYLIVEQTRGWSTLQPPTPTQFRIREVHKRVLEFLLRLDAHDIAARRQQLQDEETRLHNEWNGLIREAKIVATNVDAQIQGIPTTPTAAWPPQIEPSLIIFKDDEWRSLPTALELVTNEVRRLAEQEIPRVAEIAAAASSELAEAERRVQEKESLLSRVLNVLEAERAEAAAMETRLAVLDEDLRRNKDVITLRTLGSTMAPELTSDECPTCHQQLQPALIPIAGAQTVMSIDENIKFVSEQKRTFTAALANSRKVISARERQRSALRTELADLRGQIRALRQTLVADGRLPSIAAIRTRLELDETANKLNSASEQFAGILGQFADCSAGWKRVQAEKALLPREDVSSGDKAKVARFSELFKEQLQQYGFKSLKIDEVAVSEDTYRPEHEGFDLPTNISASDFIRVIWSYLNGLLELARGFDTNHLGLLIFDEPKQQSTKDLSFKELLTRVSSAGQFGQQVIFATSEDRAVLRQSLSGLPHTYIEFEDRIIKRIQ